MKMIPAANRNQVVHYSNTAVLLLWTVMISSLCQLAPSTSSLQHELQYFPFPGRAESIRITLWAANIPFKDTRVSFPDFQEAKKQGKYSTGLPVLIVNDTVEYTQSLALLRYAGKLAAATATVTDNDDDTAVSKELYPNDPLQALLVDQAMDIIQDFMTRCPQGKDEDTKRQLRQEYISKDGGRGYAFCVQLEELLLRSKAEGPFVNGKKLSIADLHLYFSTIAGIESGNWDYVPTTFLEDNFPAIHAVGKAVQEHPIVVNYYAELEKQDEL